MKQKVTLSLSFFAVVLFLTACSSAKTLSTANGINQRWDLHFVEDVDSTIVKLTKAYIDLGQKSKGFAKAGCNQMFFNYHLSGKDKIKVSQPGSTMMMCPEMRVENALGKLLPQINSYEVDNGNVLFKIDGRIVITGQ